MMTGTPLQSAAAFLELAAQLAAGDVRQHEVEDDQVDVQATVDQKGEGAVRPRSPSAA